MASCFEIVRTCVFEKYATFSGRAGRTEFWVFLVFTHIVCVVALMGIEYIDKMQQILRGDVIFYLIACLLAFLLGVVLIVPTISVSVRRLHDIGYSGAWYLLALVPLVGTVWLLVLFSLPSEPFKNKYDPDFVEPEEDTRYVPSMEEDVKDMNY